MAKKKKVTLKQKRVMYKDTFNPKSESKYAQKKKLQKRGIYSKNSPLG